MTKRILLSFIPFLLGYHLFSQPVPIVSDTTFVHFYRSPKPAIVFKDTIYAFFSEYNNIYAANTEELYIFSNQGTLIKQVPVPVELRIYFDLFVRNDTVFALDYYDHHSFFINANLEFEPTKRLTDLVYKDSNYTIYSADHGEWGGITWFHENRTGKEFEAGQVFPIINYWKNGYILTTSNTIEKIANPKNLSPVERGRRYPQHFKKDKFIVSDQFDGIEILYSDTSNLFSWQPNYQSIATSAILQDELFHLVYNDSSCFLATLDNKQLIPVFQFESGLKPFRWNSHDRNRIIENHQSIQFNTNDPDIFGIMEFQYDTIRMHYFKNTYEVPMLGNEDDLKILEQIIESCITDFSSLTMEFFDSIEIQNNAYELISNRKAMLLDPKIKESSFKVFRKVLDSASSVRSIYYYTNTEEKQIIKLLFKWRRNDVFANDALDLYRTKEYNTSQALEAKIDDILALLTNILGDPIESNKFESRIEYSWIYLGMRAELVTHFNTGPRYWGIYLSLEPNIN